MRCRPSDTPFAVVGDTITFVLAGRTVSGVVTHIATGQGWPCYLVDTSATRWPVWVGHEDLQAPETL